MNFKRIAGAVSPLAVLAVLYAGILRFGQTEKDLVLIVPLCVGCAFYLVIYIIGSAFRMSVRKAVVISSVLALLVSVGAGWWLFWGFGQR